jgi:hypothetical protein
LALGIDVVRGNYTAVRVAYEHLQSVGSDSSPPTTGRSALDTASIAILLLF